MLPPPDTERPTRARIGVLVFACSLSLITYLDRVCMSRAQADIQRDLGFSDYALGLVFSAFTLGYAIFEVPAGYFGDSWGPRAILTRIVLAWSVFTALTGCVWPFSLPIGPFILDALWLMLLVRFLFGAGEAGAYPLLTRVVADWFPTAERGAALGSIWMWARLGGAFAPLVLGRLSALVGWRGAFWILGGVGILWAVAFRLWFRNRPEQHPGCNEAERRLIAGGKDHVSSGHGHAWPGWGVILGNASVLLLCFSSFWLCFGWYFYPTWQPRYLADVFGFAPDGWTLEAISGAPWLCGAVGCLFGGKLTDVLIRGPLGLRWGRAVIALGGFVGAGACVLATGFVSQAWMAVTLLCVAFLINDLAVPVMWASSGDIGGANAGSLAALMNTVGAVGAILSPLCIPYMLAALPGALSVATVSGGGQGYGRVWDAQTGDATASVGGQAQRPVGVALGPRLAAFGYEGGVVRVWDARQGEGRLYEFAGPPGAVTALAFRPFSPVLVAGGTGGGMKVIDAITGEGLLTLAGHEGGTLAVAYRPDGKRVVSGGADGAVKEWDASTGELLRDLRGHAGAVRGVTYDPKGKTVISGGDDGTVRLWGGTGEPMVLRGHAGAVLGVAHSREGGLIASGGADGTVRLWDALGGEGVRTLRGHAAAVTGVAFSPDSPLLVSGSKDGTVRVWRQMTGVAEAVLDRNDGPVLGVAAGLDAGRAAWRWRIIFAGLAGAWLLAALPWLVIDTGRRLGGEPGGRAAA